MSHLIRSKAGTPVPTWGPCCHPLRHVATSINRKNWQWTMCLPTSPLLLPRCPSPCQLWNLCPEERSYILDIAEVAWVPSRKPHSIPRPRAMGVRKTLSFYNKVRVLSLLWVHQLPLLLTPASLCYSSLPFLSLITSADFWCLQANSSELILSPRVWLLLTCTLPPVTHCKALHPID